MNTMTKTSRYVLAGLIALFLALPTFAGVGGALEASGVGGAGEGQVRIDKAKDQIKDRIQDRLEARGVGGAGEAAGVGGAGEAAGVGGAGEAAGVGGAGEGVGGALELLLKMLPEWLALVLR